MTDKEKVKAIETAYAEFQMKINELKQKQKNLLSAVNQILDEQKIAELRTKLNQIDTGGASR